MKKNRIKCAICGDVIESKSVHNFVECSCHSCFVDGGNDYHRWGGNPTNIIDMTGTKPKYWNPVEQKWNLPKPFYTSDEVKVIEKYWQLARLNPDVKNEIDILTYTYVKILFEHPLNDGNKRLATKLLLSHCGVSIEMIDDICKSLAKEI